MNAQGPGRTRSGRLRALGVALVLVMIGCTRSHYRNFADKDVYQAERERALDPRWRVPDRPVEADIRSRNADPFDPDREPIPPDDPASRLFQVTNGRSHEYHGWSKRGFADIEQDAWRLCLNTNEKGETVLDRESSIRLALLHSRDYQLQVEQVYLAALALSLSRFEFYLQPFSRQQTFFNQLGGGRNERNQLQLNGQNGFSQNFASGGQLLVDFANQMIFQFNNHGFSAVTSNLAVTFTQPLIRGAFARYRTQALSVVERQTLYAVRNFAQFRRRFYVNVVAGNGYLGLLQQVQGIRNQEQNVKALSRNLEELELLTRLGAKPQKDRDFVAQNYQAAQNGLVGSTVTFETALDTFKFQFLGLPPELPVLLDDSPLKLFELYEPKLDDLREANEKLFLSLVQSEESPPRETLIQAAQALVPQFEELSKVYDQAESELKTWRIKLKQVDADGSELPLPPKPPDNAGLRRQVELSERVRSSLIDSRDAYNQNRKDLDKLVAQLPIAPVEESWRKLQDFAGKQFNARIAGLLVNQTQARVFLIELPPLEVSSEDLVQIGLQNRLDLMNARAQVTDAWRNEEVAANRLLADLNVVYQGNLGTNPKTDAIFGFDASASSHRIGLQFDAPLVRRVERNVYRASQISYQQARRNWIASRDQIVLTLRINARTLEQNRLQFEITREQLITASRQVEEAETDQRNTRSTESSNSLLLINALGSLLTAKNQLISNWVNYQTTRMGIYRDLDLMDIDGQGVWLNERDRLSGFLNSDPGDADETETPLPPLPNAPYR